MSKSDLLHLLVDRGHLIRARIEADTQELKKIEDKLKAHALAHPEDHIDLEDKEREGKQFLAHGEAITVPVVITADSLVKSFQLDSPIHHSITAAAQGKFSSFFKRIEGYKSIEDDGQKFRTLARQALGLDKSPAFLSACLARDKHGIPKNSISVAWDRAKPSRPIQP